jgi:amino acid transporter
MFVMANIFRLILGKPLASDDERAERIGVAAGIPVFGLDALSSAAYGPEAALTLLLPLGLAGVAYIVPITGAILLLLVIVYFSYCQTISAYPNGGGSYTVASENLGAHAGLLAGAALMVDYVLTVAVGISAGVGALVSAVPKLLPHTLALCLAILLLLTLVNLRGSREAGAIFMLPTILFIGSLLAMIVMGVVKAAMSGWHPTPVSAPPMASVATAGVGLWILLKAFASGCTAMTGVEAVSNGVRAFRDPREKNAERTLTVIIFLLMILLAGVAFLSWAYRIPATDPTSPHYQSVLSMLLSAVAGRGVFYYISIGSILAVLSLSANTGFADFPRLCHAIAMDRYLPFSFTLRGRRLVYSSGIYVLTGLAGGLLILYKGVTDRLIPLYAIGAFTAFTLSQSGMVVHWIKDRSAGWRGRMSLNLVGAIATGITALVVLVAKFADGAWITVLLIGAIIGVMAMVHHHYNYVWQTTRNCDPLTLTENDRPAVIIPVGGWSTITANAIQFAMAISDEVYALHVKTEEKESQSAEDQWREFVTEPAKAAGLTPPTLVQLDSPFRVVVRPVMEYITEFQKKFPHKRVAVLLPELVETHWFYYALHNQRVSALKALLYLRGNHRIAVINVPWYLERKRRNPRHEPPLVAGAPAKEVSQTNQKADNASHHTKTGERLP